MRPLLLGLAAICSNLLGCGTTPPTPAEAAAAPSSGNLSYSNAWQQYGNGQTMGGPYKAPVAVNTNVAPVTIQFSSDEAGIMTLPGGRTTAITRFRF